MHKAAQVKSAATNDSSMSYTMQIGLWSKLFLIMDFNEGLWRHRRLLNIVESPLLYSLSALYSTSRSYIQDTERCQWP